MEMDFMERQAPFRSKLYIPGLILLLLIIVWIGVKAKWTDQVFVKIGDAHLIQANGICYYNNKPLTGCIYERFPDGTFAKQIPYINGRQDGLMHFWYPDRTLQQERLFVDGKKQGVHKGWWPNGKLKFEYSFNNDEYNGSVKEWYESGKLCRFFHYSMGHEDGLQQMWWDNGTTRANYVVKDGQQYGLIGRKLCRNLTK
ncbi:toxin-antitoxin system YwqK family antitoxin [Mucilaginibacter boryungensis]|uniref:Toxin-antitoxin system YwqK family antitoxin n=1 Tax=Mucilaginibacter boryungensis TaxID=768480 RepID=A0ABR9XCA7_9SPHI|nr:toxin-antitoxin system YwqK family antitoxin [Mucilaginibacter boryungensis]MBE9664846.1 toxin-antitoxin system YwqK family antitoxin [Mucilaginibacter boryungensis]